MNKEINETSLNELDSGAFSQAFESFPFKTEHSRKLFDYVLIELAVLKRYQSTFNNNKTV